MRKRNEQGIGVGCGYRGARCVPCCDRFVWCDARGRSAARHELRERGLDPRLIDHLRRLPFPEEEKSKLDEIYPRIVELEDDEYTGDKQTETEDSEG